RPPQQRQETQGQDERCEVVDREPELVAVLALLTIRPGRLPASHAGVVDEHVQAVVVLLDLARQAARRPERGEVGQIAADAIVARVLPDRVGGARQLDRVPAVDQYGRALGRQPLGDGAPEPVGGAGHEDGRVLDGPHYEARASNWARMSPPRAL